MAGVAKHDPVEEGEGDDGEDRRVHLLIAADTVVVDQGLKIPNRDLHKFGVLPLMCDMREWMSSTNFSIAMAK